LGVGDGTVPLDSVWVSSYRLLIVTMPLTQAVWPQFAMQVFEGRLSTPVGGMRGGSGCPNWCHRVAVGQPYLLLQNSFSIRRRPTV